MPAISLSFWTLLWIFFVMIVSSGMLMLAYWILEKRLLPWWHAFFAIMGLFFIRLLIGGVVSVLPYDFLWWWLITAVYFHFVLPGPLPVWESAVMSFLQQLCTYFFGLAVYLLGFVTGTPAATFPPSPTFNPPPKPPSQQSSALHPMAPSNNPASVVMNPPPISQTPAQAAPKSITLSGMARTLGTTPAYVPHPLPDAPAPTLPGGSSYMAQPPAAGYSSPFTRQQSVNTVIPDASLKPSPASAQ